MVTRILRVAVAGLIAGWLLAAAMPITVAAAATPLVSPTPASLAWRALTPTFSLPDRDRFLQVARTLNVDVDADGDTDALAATPTGRIIVWTNVGGNRLVRRAAKPVTPGRASLGRRAASRSLSSTVDQGPFRWALPPPDRIHITATAHRGRDLRSIGVPHHVHDRQPAPRGPPPSLQ